MILTASLLRGNHPLPNKQRICELIELKAEITGQSFNQLHQFLRWVDKLETSIKTIRTDIGTTPTAQRVEIDIARALNFPGQLDSKLEDTVG